MLVSDIHAQWRVQYDEATSGEIPPNRLSFVFAKAQSTFWKRIKDAYQISKTITVESQQITIQTTVTPNASNEIVLSGLSEYDEFIAVKPNYTVSGVTYNDEWAAELLTENLNDIYSQGDYRYPRYRMVQGKILLFPNAPQCGVCEIMYFRNPYVINFNNPGDDIPYMKQVVDGILDVALKDTARIFREGEYYNWEQIEISQGKHG